MGQSQSSSSHNNSNNESESDQQQLSSSLSDEQQHRSRVLSRFRSVRMITNSTRNNNTASSHSSHHGRRPSSQRRSGSKEDEDSNNSTNNNESFSCLNNDNDTVVPRKETPPDRQQPIAQSTTGAVITDLSNIMSSSSSPPPGNYIFPTREHRRASIEVSNPSTGSSFDGDSHGGSFIAPISTQSSAIFEDFFPRVDPQWMGRSIETLLFGYLARAPILHEDADDLTENNDYDYFTFRRRSTEFSSHYHRRRSSGASSCFPSGGIRGSLSLASTSQYNNYAMNTAANQYHGGTLANYMSRLASPRRHSNEVDRSHGGQFRFIGRIYRRRSSMASGRSNQSNEMAQPTRGNGGPNVIFSLLARASTGKSCFPRNVYPATRQLELMGGKRLVNAIDQPADGIVTEVRDLERAIDTGDWGETHTIVSRLVMRLIGDNAANNNRGENPSIVDPYLPPTAPKFYAGGGRAGLERDAFVQAGGVPVLIRVFREKSFVGTEMAYSYDARDLSESIVSTRLSTCWNEALSSLRELVYWIPNLVEEGAISDHGRFLPFLFTLLSHDSCFDGAAALIEEMLSFMSQTNPSPPVSESADGHFDPIPTPARTTPAITFFLGDVPDLYKLWRGFSCRQLAHFCRILALLVFEPEDRQLLESPAILKSLELLQLRRNRAARAGRDSTVDMNQAIVLGDEELMKRLLQLLGVMNYAPPLRQFTPYHVLANYPFVGETLMMLGLVELENWDEIYRQDQLARKLLLLQEEEGEEEIDGRPLLSELGAVAEMLEGLSDTLASQPANQYGHIISVISAAQRSGLIVGRNRSRRSRRHRNQSTESVADRSNDDVSRRNSGEANNDNFEDDVDDESPSDGNTIQGIASVAEILTDQLLVRRLYQMAGTGSNRASSSRESGHDVADRYLIHTPEDAANSLQLNAMLLGPYQVEVLFVLCTLLGGRRKLDAQDILNKLGIITVLDGMFERLPWFHGRSAREFFDVNTSSDQPNGIHGPGCECTPESALCVQYLRMLHNFCDRDCDNFEGRRLLLSDDERNFIFGKDRKDRKNLKKGLLSKIIKAFIHESDESPYRFWLSSCIESYLRGSSPAEQVFVAQSGLLHHLIEDIASDRLHCSGSLQTSFDLLGELSKACSDVVCMLVNDLDEESFRKMMSVAAANLVDSNVFIRSLLLTLERLSAEHGVLPLYIDMSTIQSFRWVSSPGSTSCYYLTHSWWDAKPIMLDDSSEELTISVEEDRNADWFPPLSLIGVQTSGSGPIAMIPRGLRESVGHFGWVFTPVGDALSANTFFPNTVERLSWFLAANQARLLRDLLGVVDLRNINHENICCLNTAVVIAIFAHRRRQLALLLDELRHMNEEEKQTRRRILAAVRDDVVDRAFAQAFRYLDLNQRENPYSRRASLSSATSNSNSVRLPQIGDRSDVIRNFREVLWFWTEYYTHRGRDRLSLEFSSHIRFQEWNHVVSLLVADDGSPTSLVCSPVRLPRSPYQRAARVVEMPITRGE